MTTTFLGTRKRYIGNAFPPMENLVLHVILVMSTTTTTLAHITFEDVRKELQRAKRIGNKDMEVSIDFQVGKDKVGFVIDGDNEVECADYGIGRRSGDRLFVSGSTSSTDEGVVRDGVLS
jgi:hypothetical protein